MENVLQIEDIASSTSQIDIIAYTHTTPLPPQPRSHSLQPTDGCGVYRGAGRPSATAHFYRDEIEALVATSRRRRQC